MMNVRRGGAEINRNGRRDGGGEEILGRVVDFAAGCVRIMLTLRVAGFGDGSGRTDGLREGRGLPVLRSFPLLAHLVCDQLLHLRLSFPRLRACHDAQRRGRRQGHAARTSDRVSLAGTTVNPRKQKPRASHRRWTAQGARFVAGQWPWARLGISRFSGWPSGGWPGRHRASGAAPGHSNSSPGWAGRAFPAPVRSCRG